MVPIPVIDRGYRTGVVVSSPTVGSDKGIRLPAITPDLPAPTAFPALTDVGLPATIRPFLCPEGCREGSAGIEDSLSKPVINVNIIVSRTEVDGLSGASRGVRGEDAAGICAVEVVAGGVVGGVVIEKPLSKKALASRQVETFHTFGEDNLGAVVEDRRLVHVWMAVREGIRTSPLVGKVPGDLVVLLIVELTVEYEDFRDVAAKVLIGGESVLADFDILKGGGGLVELGNLHGVGAGTGGGNFPGCFVNHDAARISRLFQALVGDINGGVRTVRSQCANYIHEVPCPVETQDRLGAGLSLFINWLGGCSGLFYQDIVAGTVGPCGELVTVGQGVREAVTICFGSV